MTESKTKKTLLIQSIPNYKLYGIIFVETVIIFIFSFFITIIGFRFIDLLISLILNSILIWLFYALIFSIPYTLYQYYRAYNSIKKSCKSIKRFIDRIHVIISTSDMIFLKSLGWMNPKEEREKVTKKILDFFSNFFDWRVIQ